MSVQRVARLHLESEAAARARSAWYTPPPLARHAAGLLGKQRRVLEPSAGCGNLVRAALEVASLVIAVEPHDDPVGCVPGRERGRVWTYRTTFEKWTDEITWSHDVTGVLMNPPYEGGKDREHVALALELAPVVVAIFRSAVLHRDDFAPLLEHVDHVEHCITRPFKGAMSDFVIVRLRSDRPTSRPTCGFVDVRRLS